jgi:hypothetical protein
MFYSGLENKRSLHLPHATMESSPHKFLNNVAQEVLA